MLTALGAALLLSGIIGVLVTLVVALLAIDGDVTGAGITGLAGIMATLFLSYLVGGYAAGRVASRKGAKCGLLAALLGMIVRILLVIIGTIAGLEISDNLSGVVLPDVPADDERQGLGSLLAFSVIPGILILLVPFVGRPSGIPGAPGWVQTSVVG
jgi:MFS family permease